MADPFEAEIEAEAQRRFEAEIEAEAQRRFDAMSTEQPGIWDATKKVAGNVWDKSFGAIPEMVEGAYDFATSGLERNPSSPLLGLATKAAGWGVEHPAAGLRTGASVVGGTALAPFGPIASSTGAATGDYLMQQLVTQPFGLEKETTTWSQDLGGAAENALAGTALMGAGGLANKGLDKLNQVSQNILDKGGIKSNLLNLGRRDSIIEGQRAMTPGIVGQEMGLSKAPAATQRGISSGVSGDLENVFLKEGVTDLDPAILAASPNPNQTLFRGTMANVEARVAALDEATNAIVGQLDDLVGNNPRTFSNFPAPTTGMQNRPISVRDFATSGLPESVADIGLPTGRPLTGVETRNAITALGKKIEAERGYIQAPDPARAQQAADAVQELSALRGKLRADLSTWSRRNIEKFGSDPTLQQKILLQKQNLQPKIPLSQPLNSADSPLAANDPSMLGVMDDTPAGIIDSNYKRMHALLEYKDVLNAFQKTQLDNIGSSLVPRAEAIGVTHPNRMAQAANHLSGLDKAEELGNLARAGTAIRDVNTILQYRLGQKKMTLPRDFSKFKNMVPDWKLTLGAMATSGGFIQNPEQLLSMPDGITEQIFGSVVSSPSAFGTFDSGPYGLTSYYVDQNGVPKIQNPMDRMVYQKSLPANLDSTKASKIVDALNQGIFIDYAQPPAPEEAPVLVKESKVPKLLDYLYSSDPGEEQSRAPNYTDSMLLDMGVSDY